MRGAQRFSLHAFQPDMDQKTRMRRPQAANAVDSLTIDMVWLDQLLECQQQIGIRNDHAGVDIMLRVSSAYLYATGALVSNNYAIDFCARQDVAAELFEAQRQLVGKSL